MAAKASPSLAHTLDYNQPAHLKVGGAVHELNLLRVPLSRQVVLALQKIDHGALVLERRREAATAEKCEAVAVDAGEAPGRGR